MITEPMANHLIDLLKQARKNPRHQTLLSYFDLVDLCEYLMRERERRGDVPNPSSGPQSKGEKPA